MVYRGCSGTAFKLITLTDPAFYMSHKTSLIYSWRRAAHRSRKAAEPLHDVDCKDTASPGSCLWDASARFEASTPRVKDGVLSHGVLLGHIHEHYRCRGTVYLPTARLPWFDQSLGLTSLQAPLRAELRTMQHASGSSIF